MPTSRASQMPRLIRRCSRLDAPQPDLRDGHGAQASLQGGPGPGAGGSGSAPLRPRPHTATTACSDQPVARPHAIRLGWNESLRATRAGLRNLRPDLWPAGPPARPFLQARARQTPWLLAAVRRTWSAAGCRTAATSHDMLASRHLAGQLTGVLCCGRAGQQKPARISRGDQLAAAWADSRRPHHVIAGSTTCISRPTTAPQKPPDCRRRFEGLVESVLGNRAGNPRERGETGV